MEASGHGEEPGDPSGHAAGRRTDAGALGTGAFGPNAWLVEDMFDRYLTDPTSVSESWREFFADYRPAGSSPAAAVGGAPPVPAPPAAPAPPAPVTRRRCQP